MLQNINNRIELKETDTFNMWSKPNKKPQSYHNNTFSSPAGSGRASSFEEGEVSSKARTAIRSDPLKEEGEVSGAGFSSAPNFANRGNPTSSMNSFQNSGGNFESHKGTGMNAYNSNDNFSHSYSNPGKQMHRHSHTSRSWGGHNNYSGGYHKSGGVYNSTGESPPKYGSYASLSEAGSIPALNNPSNNVADANIGVHPPHPQQHWESRKRHSFGGNSRGGFDRRRSTGSRPWDTSRSQSSGRGHFGRFDQQLNKQQRNWDRRSISAGTNDASGRNYYGPPKGVFDEGSSAEGYGTFRSNDHVSESGSHNAFDQDSETFSLRQRHDVRDGSVDGNNRNNADNSYNVYESNEDFQRLKTSTSFAKNELEGKVATVSTHFGSHISKPQYEETTQISEPSSTVQVSTVPVQSTETMEVEEGQIGAPASSLPLNISTKEENIPSSSSETTKLAASHETMDSLASTTMTLNSEAVLHPTSASTIQDQTSLRLACSSLGNDKSIKALKLIKKYPDILSDGVGNIDERNPENVLLPTSDQTHNGMLELESKIDFKQKEVSELKSLLKNAIKLDAIKKAEVKRKQEEDLMLVKKNLEIDETEEVNDCSELPQSDQIIQLKSEIQKLEEKVSDLNQRIQKKESFVHEGETSVEREIHQEFDLIISAAQASVKDAKGRFNTTSKSVTDLEEKIRLTIEKGANAIDLTNVPIDHIDCTQDGGENVSITLENLLNHVKDDPVEMNDFVTTILNQNRVIAQNAHQDVISALKPHAEQSCYSEPPLLPEDPSDEEVKYFNLYWSQKASEVTGLGDALYVEPSSTPLYKNLKLVHQDMHLVLREYIRDGRLKLFRQWTELAQEYAIRQQIYTQECGHELKDIHSADMFGGSFSILGQRRGAGGAEASPQPSTNVQDVGKNRGTNNPYRRARRSATGFDSGIGGGDIVRSDYEQEQIIAQLTAQALMEKRIKEGRSDLPRQICDLEKIYTANYRNEMTHRKINDPIEVEMEQRLINPWTDVEKCIFFDRFLQHPKDFRKIASFLKNKTTHDCISFYYDSKQTVPYKAALKEHLTRKKRKGEGVSWEATIQSAISLGATVTKGIDIDRPLTFTLPKDDNTFRTRFFHPLNIELFDPSLYEVTYEETRTESKKRKSSALENLFQLDPTARKLLKVSEMGSMSKRSSYSDLESVSSDKHSRLPSQTNLPDSNDNDNEQKRGPGRRRGGATKWSEEEKESFFDSLEVNGRNWDAISEAVETKTPNQVRNFYYDNKKLLDRMKTINEIPQKEGTDDTALDRLNKYSAKDGERLNENDLNEQRSVAHLSNINHSTNFQRNDTLSLGSYFNLPMNASTLSCDQSWNHIAMQQLLFEQQHSLDRQRQLEHLAQHHLFTQQPQNSPWISNQIFSQRNGVLRDMMEGNFINNPQLYFAMRQFQQQYQGDNVGTDFHDFLARMTNQNPKR